MPRKRKNQEIAHNECQNKSGNDKEARKGTSQNIL